MNHLNKTILRDEAQILLEAITEQFEAIKAFEDKIPQIELDIIMENIRKLYENLHMLNRVGDAGLHRIPPQQEMPSVVPEIPLSPEKDRENVPEEKPPSQPAVKIMVETTPSVAPSKEHHRHSAGSPGIDLFSTESSDFTEKLKETREKSYASERISSQKKELKASISINEKFLFINELFDGNLREYNITIETLSGFKDLREALDFLDLLRIKNLWESDSMAFKRIRELVEKQF
ncbi:MAG: hypothetical protein NTW10_05715 [Bacteroidetes bacterium]|nr:hypothetical protein [Bacteroidota bacterium]